MHSKEQDERHRVSSVSSGPGPGDGGGAPPDQGAPARILVIGNGSFSGRLTDYAVRMGQRLDCEIVALSVYERGPGDGEREEALFRKRSSLGASAFADKAMGAGVKFHWLVRTGGRREVADQVVREVAGIRYVLSEPDDEDGGSRLPVISTTGPAE